MTESNLVDVHIPCPSCTSSDAYCVYADGHGHCYSCSYHYLPYGKDSVNYTYECLPWRGLTQETMKFFDIKTKIDEEGKPVSIGFKYPEGAYKVRLLDKKEFYAEGDISKEGLFGRNKFDPGVHKYVTVTEGEIDAASYWQV